MSNDRPREALLADLVLALRAVSGQGVLYSQAMAERLGVGGTDLECLDIVMMNGPLTAGDLARQSGLTSGAITGVVDRLSRAGLVKREHDHEDRRRVLVKATAAAERRVPPLSRPMQEGAVALLSAYDDQQLALILDFLTRAHEGAVDATNALRAETEARTQKPARAERRLRPA